MATATTSSNAEVRNTRLTTLVSDSENEAIAGKAEAAGLSVSAYLREKALDSPADDRDAAALRQVDAAIDRMESDLDGAIAALSATLNRLETSRPAE